MEKKQYDEIVDLLCNAERDDLVSALSGTTGFDLCKQIEQLEERAHRAEVHLGLAVQTANNCRDLYKETMPEEGFGTTVFGMFSDVCAAYKHVCEDLATTYKTITELRGQVAESLATIKTLQVYVLLLEEALLKKAEGEEISHDESR